MNNKTCEICKKDTDYLYNLYEKETTKDVCLKCHHEAFEHYCDIDSLAGGYGEAITYCYTDDDNTLWVSNGEYASQVNYCPKCGYESKIKIREES